MAGRNDRAAKLVSTIAQHVRLRAMARRRSPSREPHAAGVLRGADGAPELLLYSLAEHRELIFSCLDLVGAETVVEIGGEDGIFTRELVARAKGRGRSVWCIDPAPSAALVSLSDAEPALTLVCEKSLDALPDLEAANAYLIDGDHNYYTVLHELEAVWARAAGVAPLVVLHDIGWPWGDRDLYYAPGELPPEAVHPCTYEGGVTLGTPGVIAGGLRGEGAFAFARTAGGPANGVRTAVDDFLAAHDDLRLVVVPCIFGLGVLYAASAPWAEPLGRFLAPYDASPLLERLERNRLGLYLKVLELQDEINAARDRDPPPTTDVVHAAPWRSRSARNRT